MTAEEKFTALSALGDYVERSDEEMRARSAAFFDDIKPRHTVRNFIDKPVPRKVMENCIAAGDIDAYNNVANAFHGAIVTAAGNGLLRDAYDRVKARFRRYQTVMANIPHLPPRSVSEHEQILVAMENGDASAARDLAEGHIRDLVAAYRDTAQDRDLFTKAS